jgi:hypothetical protein
MASCYCINSSSLSLLKVSSFIATSNGLLAVYRIDVISTRLNDKERKKYHGFQSGERAGQGKGPILLIHLPG